MKTRERHGLPALTGHYLEAVHTEATRLQSDGCTGVVDVYLDACLEHDIHCRTGWTLTGRRLTPADEDAILRERIQELSFLDGWSPMAWWRWAGVRLGYLTGLVKRRSTADRVYPPTAALRVLVEEELKRRGLNVEA